MKDSALLVDGSGGVASAIYQWDVLRSCFPPLAGADLNFLSREVSWLLFGNEMSQEELLYVLKRDSVYNNVFRKIAKTRCFSTSLKELVAKICYQFRGCGDINYVGMAIQFDTTCEPIDFYNSFLSSHTECQVSSNLVTKLLNVGQKLFPKHTRSQPAGLPDTLP